MTALPGSPAQDGIAPTIRVVMAGPLPPAVGGMATVIGDISESELARQVKLVLFDTKKKTREQRPLWQGVAARLELWWRWWRVLGAGKPVIAHIHTCSGLSYFLDGSLVLLARWKRVPVVLHVHGAKFDEFLDSLSRPARVLARWIARRATRMVVLSAEWAERLSPRLPHVRPVVIENGVPISRAVARPHEARSEVMILFLGNLGQRKGIWDLLLAAERLPASARVVLVGGEEEPGVATRFVSAVKNKKLDATVRYAGPAFGAEKHDWLARADIFVLPSYAEGLPISLLEAMAAGLPVVVTPVGGIPTVISDGEDGLLVEAGNAESLAAALTRLVNDAQLRKKLGAAARARCEERFGIDGVAKQYLKLYRDMVAN